MLSEVSYCWPFVICNYADRVEGIESEGVCLQLAEVVRKKRRSLELVAKCRSSSPPEIYNVKRSADL